VRLKEIILMLIITPQQHNYVFIYTLHSGCLVSSLFSYFFRARRDTPRVVCCADIL